MIIATLKETIVVTDTKLTYLQCKIGPKSVPFVLFSSHDNSEQYMFTRSEILAGDYT